MLRKNRIDTITYFTPDDLKRLFAAITSKRDRAIFLLGYRHGLRASEIGKLNVIDIDWKRLRIKLTRLKGSFSGEHPLEPNEVRIVKAYLKERKEHHRLSDNPLLFPSNRGTPISQQTLDVLMRQCGRKAKLPEDKLHKQITKKKAQGSACALVCQCAALVQQD